MMTRVRAYVSELNNGFNHLKKKTNMKYNF